MEKEQDIDFYLKLPKVLLNNCFVADKEREFYNILYVNENLSFLLILTHAAIWNETYKSMSLEQLYNMRTNFELYGFVITNSSLNQSIERFNTMLKNTDVFDSIDVLEKWSVFRITYFNGKVDFKNPISSLKHTIANILNANNTRFI